MLFVIILLHNEYRGSFVNATFGSGKKSHISQISLKLNIWLMQFLIEFLLFYIFLKDCSSENRSSEIRVSQEPSVCNYKFTLKISA